MNKNHSSKLSLDKIKKAKELLDLDVITAEEFEAVNTNV